MNTAEGMEAARAPSLHQQALNVLQAAVHRAQEQQQMLKAFVNPGAPLHGDTSASLKLSMASLSRGWGDPNAQLDALLKDTVSTRLRQRAPTLRRKASGVGAAAAKTPTGAGSGQGKAAQGSSGHGKDDSWELVAAPSSGSQQGRGRQEGAASSNGAMPHATQAGEAGEAAGVDESQGVYYYEDDDEYAGLYEDGLYGDEEYAEGYGEGAPEAAAGGQDQILEEVLKLKLQLHDLDNENLTLRRQLEQQRLLMEQMQASLLLNAPADAAAGPSGSQGGDGAAPAAAAAAAAGAGHTSTGGAADASQPHGNGAGAGATGAAAAGATAGPTPGATPAGPSGPQLDPGLLGFDALAALPSPGVALAAHQAGLPDTPTAPSAPCVGLRVPSATAGSTSNAATPPQHQPLQSLSATLTTAYATPAAGTPAAPVAASATSTPSTAWPFALSPDVDILEGLGLSTPSMQPPAASRPPSGSTPNTGPAALPGHGQVAVTGRPAGFSAPLGRPANWAAGQQADAGSEGRGQPQRRASDGELAAILAVEQYERAQQQQPQQQHQQQLQQQQQPVVAPQPIAPPPSPWAMSHALPSPVRPYPQLGPPATAWGTPAAPMAAYGPQPYSPHPPQPGYHAGGYGLPSTYSSSSMGGGWGPFVGAGAAPLPSPGSGFAPHAGSYPAPASPPHPSARGLRSSGDAQLQGTAHWAGLGGQASSTGLGAPQPAAATASVGPGGAELQATRSAREETDWACQVCTYTHTGSERLFLKCAMCNAMR